MSEEITAEYLEQALRAEVSAPPTESAPEPEPTPRVAPSPRPARPAPSNAGIIPAENWAMIGTVHYSYVTTQHKTYFGPNISVALALWRDAANEDATERTVKNVGRVG